MKFRVHVNWWGIASMIAGYQLWGWWGVIFAFGLIPTCQSRRGN